ncbi:MAG: hypothetical protein RMI74_08495, partial [Thermodesulfobacterium sp.]|nr:hypothetical protein [Thermodesulfobacterium sp.]
KIDDIRMELTLRIDETNKRIDETNRRIDEVVIEMGKIRAEIKEAVVARETLGDIYARLKKLEDVVFKPAVNQ